MLIINTLMAFLLIPLAELLYKSNFKLNNKYNYLTMILFFGITSGIHVVLYLLTKNPQIKVNDIIIFFPISFLYILSFMINLKGLKNVKLLLNSPIINSYIIFPIILFIFFFSKKISHISYIGLVLIIISNILLLFQNIKNNKYILYPIFSSLIFGFATFLSFIYIDKLSLIDKNNALLSFEITLFFFAIYSYLFLKINNVPLNIHNEKNNILAAIILIIAQICYINVLNSNYKISTIILSIYFVLSIILAKFKLKEKITIKEFICSSFIAIGIILTLLSF